MAPGFARPGQFAAGAHRELGDGVVPARGRVNEPTVRRDRKFRAQVAAPEAFGQHGNGLLLLHRAGLRSEVRDGDDTVLLVQIVEDASVRQEGRWRGAEPGVDGTDSVAAGVACLFADAASVGVLLSRHLGDHELPGRIGFGHVDLRRVMIAGREIAGRIVGRLGRVQRARVALHIGRIAKAAVGKNWNSETFPVP